MVTRAFGTTWKAVSIMLTAMSVYAVLTQLRPMDLSALVAALVHAYETLFHGLVDSVVGWTGLTLTPLAKNILIVWSAIGGSLARTFYDLFETGAGKTSARWSRPLLSLGLDRLIFNNWLLRSMCLVAAVVLWPVALALLLRKPKVCVSDGGRKYALVGDSDEIPSWGGQQHYKVRQDLRFVFLIYLLAVAAVIGAVALLNVMTR